MGHHNLLLSCSIDVLEISTQNNMDRFVMVNPCRLALPACFVLGFFGCPFHTLGAHPSLANHWLHLLLAMAWPGYNTFTEESTIETTLNTLKKLSSPRMSTASMFHEPTSRMPFPPMSTTFGPCDKKFLDVPSVRIDRPLLFPTCA